MSNIATPASKPRLFIALRPCMNTDKYRVEFRPDCPVIHPAGTNIARLAFLYILSGQWRSVARVSGAIPSRSVNRPLPLFASQLWLDFGTCQPALFLRH